MDERFDEENPAGRWWIFDAFRPGSIRTRLLVAFIAVVLPLAAVVSAGTAVVSFQNAQEQVINQIESVATLKEAEIRIWLRSLQTNLVTTGLRGDAIQHTFVLLQESQDSADYQDAYNHLIEYYRQIELAEQFDELFLMNRYRVAILSTDATQEYHMHGHQLYFQEEWKAKGKKSYVQPLRPPD